MDQLPDQSNASLLTGIWFVYKAEDLIIRVWLSTMSGKEKVFINDELVVEKRNITSFSTIHEFLHKDESFFVEIVARSLLKTEFECNIFRNGRFISSLVNLQQKTGEYKVIEEAKTEEKINRTLSRFRNIAKKELEKYDLQDAINSFQKTLHLEPSDSETHFYLACIYSLQENTEKAFDHLQKSVEFGLKGKDRIFTNDYLAFIRIQSEFVDFQEHYLTN